ncbi:MAG: DUF2000 domain-containing protein [Anaerolineae bacterium]|nr:DUF2000 domain-containing protein [Anaerolineae bacterium]
MISAYDEDLPDTVKSTRPERVVIIVDKNLPPGRAANAAAVIALTIGARHPALVGAPLLDLSGFAHPGLIPIGLSVLSADPDELPLLRRKALAADCDVVDFPVEGQLTKNYQTFMQAVSCVASEDLSYVGLALIGRKKEISKIVGHLNLL